MTDGDRSCHLFKSFSFAFVLLFWILFGFSLGEHNTLTVPGREGIPFFDSRGNLQIFLKDLDDNLFLASSQEDNPQQTLIQVIFPDSRISGSIHPVQIANDKHEKTWLLYETFSDRRSDILAARLADNRLTDPVNISAGVKGFNFSPRMDFAKDNSLQVIWVNYDHETYRIIAKDMSTGRSWEIFSSPTAEASNPQILTSGTGRIWAFWVSHPRNHDEILYAFFNGARWTEPASLNRHADVPHITPTAALDYEGFPHVVWSAYDGADYELYYSSWDGRTWAQEEKITENLTASDISPSLCLFLKTVPVIVWQRCKGNGHEVVMAFKNHSAWQQGVLCSSKERFEDSPRIVSSEGRMGILLQHNGRIQVLRLRFHDLYRLSDRFNGYHRTQDVFPSVGMTAALDRDKYIGFGDSITYGVINGEGAPEKGYIPRLASLIDQNIKQSDVVNSGVGGEKTSEGLGRIGSVINAEQAKTMFLMEGTNDVKHSSVSTDTVAYNLKRMSEDCINLGMEVFLASIIPTDPWEGLLKERVLELNQKIQQVAANLGIHFVDQYSVFIDYADNWRILFSDATHPNETGYQVMAETWYFALAGTLPHIETDTTSLSFEAILEETGASAQVLKKAKAAADPPPQTFRIKNSGENTLSYEISVDKPWLAVSPENGDSTGEWDDIQVAVDISGLSPGTYAGTVTITADYATNSPQEISVTLTIRGPRIKTDQSSLSFASSAGGDNPPPQTFTIRNSGAGTLRYELVADKNWLEVTPESGESTGEEDAIQVAVSTAGLSRGTHTGTITITAAAASNSPQIVSVTLTIRGPRIETDQSSLSFEGVAGKENPPAQSFRLRNSGEETLSYQISKDMDWLSATPENGESTGEWDAIQVAVSTAGLSRGTHTGTITITGEFAANSPLEIPVELVVRGPIIELDTASLSFEAVADEDNPPPQAFTIRNSGEGTLEYQISKDNEWISVSPEAGESTGEADDILVAVDISGLNQDSYQGTVTVSSFYASNNPQQLTIDLRIEFPPLFAPADFHGEKRRNRSLAMIEYLNELKWQAHPQNTHIVKYRVYLVEDGMFNRLAELDSQTFEYRHRKVDRDKTYTYGLTAVDKWGRESAPVLTEVK